MTNNKKTYHAHCPEVEKLTQNKMPFITRYGITIVLITLILVGATMFLLDGTPQQLMREILSYIIEQITIKL